MQGEMKRIEAGVKMEPLDETRMSIEPPRLHEQQDPEAWTRAVNNASAQLEHQYHRCAQQSSSTPRADVSAHKTQLTIGASTAFFCFRVQNFKLAVKFGPAVWKAHNARSSVYLKIAKNRLKDVKEEITKVNQRRKLQQEKAKGTLDRLQKEYNDLVKSNCEIALACKKLEMERDSKEPPQDAEMQSPAAEEGD